MAERGERDAKVYLIGQDRQTDRDREPDTQTETERRRERERWEQFRCTSHFGYGLST